MAQVVRKQMTILQLLNGDNFSVLLPEICSVPKPRTSDSEASVAEPSVYVMGDRNYIVCQ